MTKTRLILAGFILAWILGVSQSAAEPVAVIVRTRGFVLARHEDADRGVLVEKGFLCNSGTVIRTGRTGMVELRYTHSMTTVQLAPRTEVSVYQFRDLGYTTESCRIKTGWARFDVAEKDSSSLDVFSGSNLLSVEDSRVLVIRDEGRLATTIFNFGGFSRVADPMYEDWVYLAPYSVAFVAGDSPPQTGIIHPEELPRMMEIISNLEDLEPPSGLIHELVLDAGEGGRVSPKGRLPVVGGVGTDIIAEPSSAYRFVGWRVVKGLADIRETVRETTLVRVAAGAEIEARFSRNPVLLHIESDSDLGRVVPHGTIPVEKDQSISVKVWPHKGYGIERWETSRGVTVSEDENGETLIRLSTSRGKATPIFSQKKYRLIIEKSEGGSTSPRDSVEVAHGEKVLLEARPDSDHYFLRWRVQAGHAVVENIRSPQTEVLLDSTDARIVAEFADNPIEVEVYGSSNALVEPTGSFFVERNEPVALKATPEKGFRIAEWEALHGRPRIQGLEDAVLISRRPARLKPVVEKMRYRLDLKRTRFGKTSPSRGMEVVHGEPVLLNARPRRNKYFLGWRLLGGWAEIENPHAESTSVTLSSGDAVLLARFSPTICSLHVESTEGGYVEPTGLVRNCEDCPQELIAVPDLKAAFVEWRIAEGDSDRILLEDTLTSPEQTAIVHKGAASIRAIFTTETAKLRLATNGLGRVDPENEKYIVRNRWTKIQAIPNRGQRFLQWTPLSGAGVRIRDTWSAETEVFVEQEDAVVRAVFVPDTADPYHPLDTLATGDTSLVSFIYHDQMGTVDKGARVRVPGGVPFTVSATGRNEFSFHEWKVLEGAVTVENRSTATTSLTPLSKEVRIMPVFTPRSLKSLNVRFYNSMGESKTITVQYQ